MTVEELVSSLTLEEKVALLTGRDAWNTVALERIGLRSMLLSDGPIGVRGETWDERDPSLCLPSSTALASAWSRDVAARFGVVLAGEARRKGADVVLGPTINLHRTPYGGRHFECMSEDPLLTGVLAAAYVDGIQSNGVGATPKHYVANDFETDRFTVDVVVEERALREVYLRPFEDVVRAGAWSIMSSYNSINGVTSSENDLLEDPLKTEWGFDGVVMSDWTAVRSLESAAKEQDLVMPGPEGPWGRALIAAVRAGAISEKTIDRKVRRLILLAARVGALESVGGAPPAPAPVDGIAFAREAAIAGSVLLRNTGVLPISATATVAVIGHNAVQARIMGGGSATVIPEHVVSPYDGIAAVASDLVSHSPGAIVEAGIAELPLVRLVNPFTGEPGVRVTFTDATGATLYTDDRWMTNLTYFGGDAPVGAAETISVHTRYRIETAGVVELGYAGIFPATLDVDGTELLRYEPEPGEGEGIDGLLKPPTTTAPVEVATDQTLDLVLTLDVSESASPLGEVVLFRFGLKPDDSDPDGLIAAAVDLAARSDIAVVVVGTNSEFESEGFDRTTLALPGHQDELVRAVAAVNPNTVVVVNSGSPVTMPWREEVGAVLVTYFPGQEFGNALADILYGVAEPGGRLSTTWPKTEDDVPIGRPRPVDGRVRYDEGIHIGYRAWLRSGVEPAYPFGYGLGYTSWRVDSLSMTDGLSAGESFTVTVGVTNTGERRGKQVVQVYAERTGSRVDRPARWLIGFADFALGAGESADIPIAVSWRELANYDNGWWLEPGAFDIYAGFSSADTPAHGTLMAR